MKKILIYMAALLLPSFAHAADLLCLGAAGCPQAVDIVTLANSTPQFTAIGFVDGTTQTTAAAQLASSQTFTGANTFQSSTTFSSATFTMGTTSMTVKNAEVRIQDGINRRRNERNA